MKYHDHGIFCEDNKQRCLKATNNTARKTLTEQALFIN
jgi:hypothetical protein